MFANLTEAVKRRIIQELRAFWSIDPEYKDTLAPNIQGRYSFDERPQQAIIVKGASANPQSLSADNYQGTIVSYCNLTKMINKPGVSIEWVREDGLAIQRNDGVFPSLPGVYYIEVVKEEIGNPPTKHFVFYVDPLLEVVDENPTQTSPTTYVVSNGSFYQGSLRIYEMPGNIPMYDGIDYMADATTGVITLTKPCPSRTFLSVDYRYAGESTGPFIADYNCCDNTAIPGVVLAFGRRITEGDVLAVVVGRKRESCALEYGGRWELNLDMDIMSRDVLSAGEITDRTLMHLYVDVRSSFASEGIEIVSVSMGGETEESYDDNADDYFYTSSISMTIQTDWFVYVPLNWSAARILPGTLDAEQALSQLSDDQLIATGSPSGIQAYENLNLQFVTDPYFRGRNSNFEMII